MDYQNADLSSLIAATNSIAAETHDTFAHLTPAQLNWKPSAERWSVAQCFDHLINSNRGYFPIVDDVLAGYKRTFWQSMPVLPGVMGKLLIKSLDPVKGRNLKAPKNFQPAQSDISAAVIDEFVAQQATITGKMKATTHLDLERIIISSPVTSVVTYSLMDAYRVIVVHERRHFQQAQRVTQESGFPA
jgi:hypothetical protein